MPQNSFPLLHKQQQQNLHLTSSLFLYIHTFYKRIWVEVEAEVAAIKVEVEIEEDLQSQFQKTNFL